MGPNPDEAREQAWRDYWLSRDPAHALGHRTTFDGGWDARGQYDQQRIAALMEAAQEAVRAGYAGEPVYVGDLLDALDTLEGQT